MSIKVKHAAWLSAEWERGKMHFLQTPISNIVNSHRLMYTSCKWHHIARTLKMWSKFFHLCLARSLSSLTPNWTLFKLFIAVCVPDFLHCTRARGARELSGKVRQRKAFNQVCAAQFMNSAHIFTMRHKYSTCGQWIHNLIFLSQLYFALYNFSSS